MLDGGVQKVMSSDNFAICVIADEKYKWYVPLFLYSMWRFHPDIPVIVFRNYDDDDGEIEQATDSFTESGIYKYNVYDVRGDFKGKDHPYYTAAVRFCMFEKQLSIYDYVLWTDIDMIICDPGNDICRMHVDRISRDKTVCYENFVTQHDGESRLAGVHFIATPWWDATRKERESSLRALSEMRSISRTLDECNLYNIVRRSNLNLSPVSHGSRERWRHHGLHIGDWRYCILHGMKVIVPLPLHVNVLRKLMAEKASKDLIHYIAPNIKYMPEIVKQWSKHL